MAFTLFKATDADIKSLLSSDFIPRAPEPPLQDDVMAIIEESASSPRHVATLSDLPTSEEIARGQYTLRTFSDLGELTPEDEDPTILFRHNWLAQGQSFMLVSSSGVGKSSMSVQMSFFWSQGLEFLAAPMRPLKVCIIQSEDSDRDLKEQREGMRIGFAEHCEWSRDLIAKAESEVVISPDFVGYAGDRFIERLKDFQRTNRFDLIVINPVQAFFGGDVSSQEDVSHFCREGLDPIMKDPAAPCCIGIVAHTPKQKSGDKQGRQSVDDYGEYMIAGSHEWTDWARAAFVFLKSEKYEGVYDFVAAKRGHVLRWKRSSDGERTTKKHFAHSDGYIFWRDVTAQVEAGAYSSGDGEGGVEDDGMMNAYVCALADFIKRGDSAVCRTFVRNRYKEIGLRRTGAEDIFRMLCRCAGKHGLLCRDFYEPKRREYVPYIGTEAQIKRLSTQLKQRDDYAEMMGGEYGEEEF